MVRRLRNDGHEVPGYTSEGHPGCRSKRSAPVAEVDVELLEDETGWFPYLSVEDSYKLDDVRDALRRGDLDSAAKYGRIYELRAGAQR
ncbi:hypothetical protein FDQ92_03990 [Desulfoglaeba alkanexedens ALDC]|uniref:Uncharacterized protein n=1 Tax=Desulfoglaeba alkanexedens ALDC TaxID=980445 RepID=A0A4P8L1F5_9BACT|nr:hypothetical protein FDQ92_03990 [Desulfoglaeba alkanexedens ALDC]